MIKGNREPLETHSEAEETVIRNTSSRYATRGEILADWIFIGMTLLVTVVATIYKPETTDPSTFHWFLGVYLGTAAFLGLVLLVLASGYTRPWVKFLVLFIQVSAISAGIMLDVRKDFAFGPLFMMAYCVVIGLTSFRLSPSLAIFAGLTASIEVFLIDWVQVQPLMHADPPRLDLVREYGAGFMLVAVAMLAIMGVASGLAAKDILKTLRQQIRELLRRQQTESVFGRYVSPEIAEEVLHPEAGRVEPRLAKVAILFCDIRGFTAFSQDKAPAAVVSMVEEYWLKVCTIVDEEKGIVSKFIGDGIMVLFGVPDPDPEYIVQAAKTALRLSREVDQLLKPYGLQLCVGIHAGEVIAGEIGSGTRCEYTVLG
ncbi:MAG: adenylate/guanylate cyclase domain-containing protein, partial [Chthoniobacterales bacterium]